MIRGGSSDSNRARLIAIVSLVALILLTVAVGTGVVFPFDAPLLAAARTLDGVPMVWQVMSQTANFPLIAIAIVLVLWLIRIKRYREAGLVFLILAAVTAGSEGASSSPSAAAVRQRRRDPGCRLQLPVRARARGHDDPGAPGRAGLAELKAPPLRLACAGVVAVEVILVAVARLALNEHYPTDLLAGFLGSLVALGWYAWLTRPGGWADVPAASPARRPAREISSRPTGARPKEAAA